MAEHDLDARAWASILKFAFSGEYDNDYAPLPEPTDLPPGRDKIDVLTLRASAGQQLFSPDDATALPAKLRKKIVVGRNGRIVEESWEYEYDPDVNGDFDEFDDLAWDADPVLPTTRVDWLASHGVSIGNPTVAPCSACTWRHEEAGRCTWCGALKTYSSNPPAPEQAGGAA